MRGKIFRHTHAQDRFRITPAYAGKKTAYWEMCGKCQDHPRLCGEKFFRRIRPAQLPGSPPPMRGKNLHTYLPMLVLGITPAYAGKNRTLYAEAKNYEDHPRLCGEK